MYPNVHIKGTHQMLSAVDPISQVLIHITHNFHTLPNTKTVHHICVEYISKNKII